MRKLGVLNLGAIVTFSTLLAGAASAARLELLDDQRIEEASPSEALEEPPCTVSVNQLIDTFVAANGRSASTLVQQDVDVCTEGTDNSFAQQAVALSFLIAPDPGESIGDDVRIFVKGSFEQSATQAGACTAQSAVGGEQGVGPAVVVLNPSGSAMTAFSYGPKSIMGNNEIPSENWR